ncbi:MAG: hypothetical protein H7A40_04350 [Chlamydiales bacterium]|nr:hypothetical protein [Chlamydiales bacterium]
MVAAFMIAKIFGPLLLIVGIWNLFYRHKCLETGKALTSHPACLCLFAIINLIVGLTIVTFFNHWVWDLTLLVTLLGWFMIVRGVIALYWPEALVGSMLGSAGALTFWAIVWIVWGFFLTWLGYFCEMGRHMTMM